MVVDTDRHNLTVFYLKSFDMDSVQVGKAVFVKEIYTTLVASVGLKKIYIWPFATISK